MPPFRWRYAFFIGLISYAASLAAPIFDTFVPVFLQAGHPLWQDQTGMNLSLTGFALGPAVAFFIMTWDNLINLFLHPWAGAASDRTWNRWGRRKGWLLVGVPIAAVGLVAIPLATTVVGVMAAILVANLGRAIFVPPMVAWLGDLFPNAHRSQANATFGLIAGIAAILILVASGALFEQVGRVAPFLLAALLTLLLAGAGFLFVREPPPEKRQTAVPALSIFAILRRRLSRDPNWRQVLLALFFASVGTSVVSTGASSFAVFELGMSLGDATTIQVVSVLAFILFALPSGVLATRIGRRPTVSLGILLVLLTDGATYFFVYTPALLAVTLFVAGIGAALVLINILPLVFDVGISEEFGAFTGLSAIPTQAAAIVGPSMAGLVVQAVGSQRVLFLVALIALLAALFFLQQVQIPEASNNRL